MALSVSIELVSSSARVTSVKSQQGVSLTDGQTSGPKDRTPGLPGSDKNFNERTLVHTNVNANILMKELWFVQRRFNAILMAPFIETDLAAGCWQKKLGKHFPFTQD